ncbi:MAG TPA: polysaccharide deacetylase family protein [Chloroflexota bacterium]|jgi:peptidoglycan/xylan/chitin deacetylase (PgdA/CDA1 family)|nr:polysaccharide deacetylase family protein [Chloroflexota bacterium]
MENQLYDYWPIPRRPRLEWPNGARLAFWIGLNIEHYEIDKPSTSIFSGTAMLKPDPLNYGWRDYGPRVGVWRMMEVLDKYGLRASVLLNSDVCHYYPEIIEAGNQRRWVWLAHGKNNSILQANMSLEEERRYLTEVVTTIREGTGQQPKGWLGPALTETFNTPDLLAELGLTYLLDWCNDDQPYPLKVKQGRMISVPYSIEVNDIPLFVGKTTSGEDFYRIVVDQFDQLYEEGARSGRVMALALHPFIINQPFRHKYLDRALAYITQHDQVWLTTSDEIADWYYQHYYDQAVALSARSR